VLLRYDFICIVQVIDLRNIVCMIDSISRWLFLHVVRYEKRQVYRSTLLMISTLLATLLIVNKKKRDSQKQTLQQLRVL
jgi:hypothetical protein